MLVTANYHSHVWQLQKFVPGLYLECSGMAGGIMGEQGIWGDVRPPAGSRDRAPVGVWVRIEPPEAIDTM